MFSLPPVPLEAKAQGGQADRWRAIAIGLGVATAIAAAYVLVEFPETSIDTWQLVIGKVAVGLTVGAVAGYAASQSARHRRREERAKHLELNLETFGRLSSELGPENLEVARSALVDTMLKVDEVGSGGHPGKDSISDDQINVIGRLIDQIQKVRGLISPGHMRQHCDNLSFRWVRERPLQVIHPELDVLVPAKTTGALSAQLAVVHLAHLSILDPHQCNSVIGLIHAASRPLKHTDITCAGCFKFCDYYLPSLGVPPIES